MRMSCTAEWTRIRSCTPPEWFYTPLSLRVFCWRYSSLGCSLAVFVCIVSVSVFVCIKGKQIAMIATIRSFVVGVKVSWLNAIFRIREQRRRSGSKIYQPRKRVANCLNERVLFSRPLETNSGMFKFYPSPQPRQHLHSSRDSIYPPLQQPNSGFYRPTFSPDATPKSFRR